MAEERDYRLVLNNRRVDAVFFALEPYGMVYRMPAGATFEIVSSEPMEAVSFEEDLISVWGVEYAVFHNGVELALEDQINIDAERRAARR